MSLNDFEKLLDKRLAAERCVLWNAQHNPQFRALLKADPARALKEILGQTWDPAVKLEVIEETADRCVLVLPPLLPEPSAANDDELTDDELEMVAAGGNTPNASPPTCYVDRFGVEKCQLQSAGESSLDTRTYTGL